MKTLDVYDYLLASTKRKYVKMTENLNKIAMSKPEEKKAFFDLDAGATFSQSLDFGVRKRVLTS